MRSLYLLSECIILYVSVVFEQKFLFCDESVNLVIRSPSFALSMSKYNSEKTDSEWCILASHTLTPQYNQCEPALLWALLDRDVLTTDSSHNGASVCSSRPSLARAWATAGSMGVQVWKWWQHLFSGGPRPGSNHYRNKWVILLSPHTWMGAAASSHPNYMSVFLRFAFKFLCNYRGTQIR